MSSRQPRILLPGYFSAATLQYENFEGKKEKRAQYLGFRRAINSPYYRLNYNICKLQKVVVTTNGVAVYIHDQFDTPCLLRESVRIIS